MNLDEYIDGLRSQGRSSPGGFAWHEFWVELQKASQRACDKPPVPLILAASACSNSDKLARLREQLIWAAERGRLVESIQFLEAIPLEFWNTGSQLNWHRDSFPSGHSGWTSDPKPKLLRQQRKDLINQLKEGWSGVAGDQLSLLCQPVRLTGRKGRRLVVDCALGSRPPWGSWQSFSLHGSRESFATLRAAVNRALAPHAVDHIDFVERVMSNQQG